MEQHVLDDCVEALAVLYHLVEIALEHIRDFTDFRAQLGVELCAAKRLGVIRRLVLPSMAEKLLTKSSGFLISCAMPAVNCPSEASFSVCTRRSCAVRRLSSDLAQFVQQPRVFHRDDCLCGEVLHQHDLLIGKRSRFLPVENDRTEKSILLAQRDAQQSVDAVLINDRPGSWISGAVGLVLGNIADMDKRLARHDPAKGERRCRRPGPLSRIQST